MRKKRSEEDEVTLILRDLKCEDWIIRQEAVGRIGRLKNPSDLTELINRLPEERWYIREMVAAGIRSINNTGLSDPLKKGLISGDDCTRNACARALGIMKCAEAEEILKKAAEDPDSRVRKTARISLEMIQE